MTFLVEFHLTPGSKNKVLEEFEKRGPNRNPGVKFISAWVATRSDFIYAVVESLNEEAVTSACQGWSESGDYSIEPVVSIDQY